ncbi:MAG: hypothetical protein ROO73_04340 [Roseivirga sp.]
MVLYSQPHPNASPRIYATHAAYTSGTISGKSSITIQLRHAPTHQVDSQALERLFSFSASLQGTVSWTDERTLTFTPQQALPSGKQFKAKFYLSRLQDVPASLKTFTFQFQTLEQALHVDNERLDGGARPQNAPTYQDIRDDRVYSYFDLKQHETKTFRVLLHVTYAGRYYLPTVSCEAMKAC